jgi:hypothetical protein
MNDVEREQVLEADFPIEERDYVPLKAGEMPTGLAYRVFQDVAQETIESQSLALKEARDHIETLKRTVDMLMGLLNRQQEEEEESEPKKKALF